MEFDGSGVPLDRDVGVERHDAKPTGEHGQGQPLSSPSPAQPIPGQQRGRRDATLHIALGPSSCGSKMSRDKDYITNHRRGDKIHNPPPPHSQELQEERKMVVEALGEDASEPSPGSSTSPSRGGAATKGCSNGGTPISSL